MSHMFRRHRKMLSKLVYSSLLGLVILSLSTAVFAQTISETFKVIPTAVDTDDQFGFSVAVSGSTVVAGARFDEDLGLEAGAAYQVDANSGAVIRKILAVDPASDNETFGNREDFFGESVAVEGNVAVIGAPLKSQGGTNSGAVYLYNMTTGNLISRLLPFSPINDDTFFNFYGFSVGISDNYIVVGAPGDVEGANGGGGAAYIYTAGNQQVVGKIFASDIAFADNFGRRVAVSNSIAAISSPFDDDRGTDSGSVYLFDAATAQQQRKLTASDGAANDLFGLGVAINGDIVAVGAPFDDDLGTSSGSVYLFNATTGQQLAKITAADGQAGSRFGESVDIDGSTLIVGAPLDNGIGAAYLFDIATATQQAKLVASDGQAGDGFGGSVSVSGSNVVIGAAGDDDNGSLSGSIYLFTLGSTPIVTPTSTPESTSTPGATPTNTPEPTPTNTPEPTPTNTPEPTPTATPISGTAPTTLYVSSTTGGNVGGVRFNDEDVLVYDIALNTWALFFDGSDVGLAAADVDGFARLDDGSLLLSFNNPITVNGIAADDSDVLRFVPTSLGTTTAGTFSMYIDGSDVGLTTNGEDIDSLTVVSQAGNSVTLLIGTTGNFNVPGLAGHDEDLALLTVSQTGNNTIGSWSPFFDGSDVGLANSSTEDVLGASLFNGDLYLTTLGAFAVNGVSGDGSDVLRCGSLVSGAATSCSYTLFLDGANIGIGSEVIDALLVSNVPAGLNSISAAAAESADAHDGVDDVDLEDNEQYELFLPEVGR
ncbi:hypothetical protein GC175_11405 [bacterium]|nr:hypothetical protein [bacterium]